MRLLVRCSFSMSRRAACLAAIVACAISLPASAQAPAVNAMNAQFVAVGYVTFAESSPQRWQMTGATMQPNGTVSNGGPYSEVQRNETSIQVKPTSGVGTAYVLDFAKKMIYFTDGKPWDRITETAAVSGLSVSAVEMTLSHQGKQIGTVSLTENFTNGTPVNWTLARSFNPQPVTVALKDVTRTPREISFILPNDTRPFKVNVITRTCNNPAFACRVTKAASVTGYNVGEITFGYMGQLFSYYKISARGEWRLQDGKGGETNWTEKGGTADSIDLVKVGDTITHRFYLNGSGKLETIDRTGRVVPIPTSISAQRVFPGQLGTIFQPVTPDISPGFQIQNKTDYPVLLSLDQVGCLYYGIVQPGAIFKRNTGAVWFTIRASMSPKLEMPTDWDCAQAPLIFSASVILAGATAGSAFLAVPAMLFSAAGQGASIMTQDAIKASGGSSLQAGAAGVGVDAIWEGATVVGLALLNKENMGKEVAKESIKAMAQTIATGAIAVAKDQMVIREAEQADIDAIRADLVQETSVFGAYAGYPWPWPMSDRVMPVYEVTGGPRVAKTRDGSTVVLKQEQRLTLRRVN